MVQECLCMYTLDISQPPNVKLLHAVASGNGSRGSLSTQMRTTPDVSDRDGVVRDASHGGLCLCCLSTHMQMHFWHLCMLCPALQTDASAPGSLHLRTRAKKVGMLGISQHTTRHELFHAALQGEQCELNQEVGADAQPHANLSAQTYHSPCADDASSDDVSADPYKEATASWQPGACAGEFFSVSCCSCPASAHAASQHRPRLRLLGGPGSSLIMLDHRVELRRTHLCRCPSSSRQCCAVCCAVLAAAGARQYCSHEPHGVC